MGYNVFDQMTTITPAGGSAVSQSYTGQSQSQRVLGDNRNFAYSIVGMDSSTQGGNAAFYVRDTQGTLTEEQIAGQRFYYIFDGLGSVVAVTDQNGNVANTYRYEPFGKISSQTGSTPNPWTYAGGYLDGTGLVKFGSRYYDPSLGRWTQRDAAAGSILNPNSVNRFLYAADDPVTLTDVTGFNPTLDFIGYTIATVGFFLAAIGLVAAIAVSAPVWITVLAVASLVVATAALYLSADVLACDSGFGIAC
jgi:RHS repeat-associated protein